MSNSNRYFPAIKLTDGSVQWLNIQDVIYTSVQDRFLVFHTKEEQFRNIVNLEDMEKLISDEDYLKLDRGNLVKMESVTFYDSEYGKVFFDPVLTTESKYATVAHKHINYLKKTLGPEKDIANNRPPSRWF